MKKYIAFLILALVAFAGLSQSGIKLQRTIAEIGPSGSFSLRTCTDGGQNIYGIYNTNPGTGLLRNFISFNANLSVKKQKTYDLSFGVFDLIYANQAVLVASCIEKENNGSWLIIPRLIAIDPITGDFLFDKSYAEATCSNIQTFSSWAKIIPSTNGYIIAFYDKILRVDTDGNLLSFVDLKSGTAPISLAEFDSEIVLLTRKDSLQDGYYYSYYYKFFVISSSDTDRKKPPSSGENWDVIVNLNPNGDRGSSSEKAILEKISNDSFKVTLYNHWEPNSLVTSLTFSKDGYQKSEINVPSLAYASNQDLHYSKKNNHFYFTSNVNDHLRMVISSNLLDTIAIFDEKIDDVPNAFSISITELSDGSFFMHGFWGQGLDKYIALNKISRTPFKPIIRDVREDQNLADIYWNEPVSGGSPITSYEVWYKPSNDGKWFNYETESILTEERLTGLKFGQPYELKVRAINEVGFGEFSETISFQTQIASANNRIKQNKLLVYPNPVISGSNLTVEPTESGWFTIYNSVGQELFKKKIVDNIFSLPLFFPPGIYYYTLQGDNGNMFQGNFTVK